MTKKDLLDYILETYPVLTGTDKVMIRNCVDGKLYEIDEFSQNIRGNEAIMIIDIKPEEQLWEIWQSIIAKLPTGMI